MGITIIEITKILQRGSIVTYRNTTAQETVHLPGAPQDLVDVHRDLGFVLDVDGF